MFNEIYDAIREIYASNEAIIPLHEPRFLGNEKKYLQDAVDSTFVSSVGPFVDLFEQNFSEYIGSNSVVTTNGTSALHLALKSLGVGFDDEVITQSLTFVATCNAISYCNASPVFIDIDERSLGLDPNILEDFLKNNTFSKSGNIFNKETKRRIKAILPMHTFGNLVEIESIVEIANRFNLPVIEDAAESLGSKRNGKHSGTFGLLGCFSFNGNKIITTGGGGMICTSDEDLSKRLKHLSTTAKESHPYEFIHDEVAFNYRMPNINAALGVAQLEKIEYFLNIKEHVYETYLEKLKNYDHAKILEPQNQKSNNWLITLIFDKPDYRDNFLVDSNSSGIMTRPPWKPMHLLKPFKHCYRVGNLENTIWAYDSIANIPSSVPLHS